jgi:hypothetical protein
MKNFDVEYEIPPLRAIYRWKCEAKNEQEAKALFKKENPLGRIRKFLTICGACGCVIDNLGCGCNPPDA